MGKVICPLRSATNSLIGRDNHSEIREWANRVAEIHLTKRKTPIAEIKTSGIQVTLTEADKLEGCK